MIRTSKWIEIHSPYELAERVAARTIDGRLRLVGHYLPLAASAADDNDEHVHQTRVATRRAMTALSIFSHQLPRKRAEWFRKQLKRVRKAASDAREYDVLAGRLNERLKENGPDPTCDELIGWIHDQRRAAQRPIREIASHLDKKHYKRRAKRLVQKVLKKGRRRADAITFGQLAHQQMRTAVNEFFACGQEELHDLDKLHQFRVCGKHLRYAMEVFAGAFPREFRDALYPQVEALQEQLGKINDHANAKTYYERWLNLAEDDARRALLRELIDDESAAINRLHDEFLQEWTSDRASTLQQGFMGALTGVTA